MTKKAYLLILTAAALWGFMGVFLKMLTAAGFTNLQAVAVRVTLAAILFALFLLVTDRNAFYVRLKDLWCFIGSGIVSLLLFNLCYFNAIALSSMSVAAVLLYTAPAFVMLLSILIFKEKFTGRKLLSLVMTLAGCILVTGVISFGTAPHITLKAALLGIGSGFFYALYSIFGKFALRKYSPATLTLYTFVFAAVGALPMSGIFTKLDLFCSVQAVGGTIGLAVMSCILPYLLYSTGLKYVEAGKAAVMATLEPVVASILGIILYHDDTTWTKILGILLVVAAIVIMNISRPKKVYTGK
jgi:DME family drug/metabolite transporter